MKYETAGAFLMALKDHTRTRARVFGVSPQRLQKEIVFERLMAHLLVVAPDRWAFKGASVYAHVNVTAATETPGDASA